MPQSFLDGITGFASNLTMSFESGEYCLGMLYILVVVAILGLGFMFVLAVTGKFDRQ